MSHCVVCISVVLRLDNSKANLSKALKSVCALHRVTIQYIEVGQKNQNAHVICAWIDLQIVIMILIIGRKSESHDCSNTETVF